MFILYLVIAGSSAFSIQPEEHTGAARNCHFRGKYFKKYFTVEAEPLVLKCPYAPLGSRDFDVIWRENASGRVVPGEETRMWVQNAALWFLPALQTDSGTYICTIRNASYCDEMSVELKVLENTDASLPFISYLQLLTVSTSGLLVCPELREFTYNMADVHIQWYKDSALLDEDSKKFRSLKGTTHLLIHNVSMVDSGYYSCHMSFPHNGTQYNITRNIKVRVNQKEEEPVPVIVSPHQTILTSLGSKLTIPCKVFLGVSPKSSPIVWWTANDTLVENAYPSGRATQGPFRKYSENNENYIEVPLVFDPVIREDLNTDFKCSVRNTVSLQTLRTTVKEAATFSWGIALAPLSLVFLVLGGVCLHRCYKHRAGKSYGLTTIKTGHEEF